MRTIVHLSDLHFGRIDASLISPLIAAVNSTEPHVVAVSGDLTQHALLSEFEQARALLDQLAGARIVVPGNHDLSFYNPVRRVVQRLALYKRHITSNFEPSYRDEEILVLGLNTARVPLFRGGSFSEAQLRKVDEHMRAGGEGLTRVLVTHHPFDLPERFPFSELVRGARRVMERLLASVDIMLAGHMHISHSGATAERYKLAGNSAVFIQAGTALSSRVRGEGNSFNVLRIGDSRLDVEVWGWEPPKGVFESRARAAFRRETGGWAAHA